MVVGGARSPKIPSLQQALAELRDALDPAALRGALGFLVDGPPPPTAGERHPPAPWVAALAREATGLVLLSGAAQNELITPHAAVDVQAADDRRLARVLRVPLVVAADRQAALDRALLPAPIAWYLDGERDRLERTVVDRVRAQLMTTLMGLGLVLDARRGAHSGALLRKLDAVESEEPGLVEPLVAPGDEVARGQPVATCGATGSTREALHAGVAGVVLSVRNGWCESGAVVVIGKRTASAFSPTKPDAPYELGWCELVDLPELGVSALPAKIDTGARTCALHVQAQRLISRERGRAWWEIEVPDGGGGTVRARVEVIEQAVVRDSGGHAERRPVIETLLVLGRRARRVRLSLTDRGDMRFPMLVGRTAFDEGTRIDPTRSFLLRPDRRRRSRS